MPLSQHDVRISLSTEIPLQIREEDKMQMARARNTRIKDRISYRNDELGCCVDLTQVKQKVCRYKIDW